MRQAKCMPKLMQPARYIPGIGNTYAKVNFAQKYIADRRFSDSRALFGTGCIVFVELKRCALV